MRSHGNAFAVIGVMLGVGGVIFAFHAHDARDDLMMTAAGAAALLGYAFLYLGCWSR